MKTEAKTNPHVADPQPGELWEFPIDQAGVLGWVVIKVHPEDQDLMLVVPADAADGVGPRDLAVPQVAQDGVAGRLVLRGDWTHWVPRTGFWFRSGEKVVPREWRREFLARVRAGLDTAPAGGASLVREEVLEWADHKDWIRDVLGPASEHLERWADRESRWQSLDAGVHETTDQETPEIDDLALAADGPSALESLASEAMASYKEEQVEAPRRWELSDVFTSGEADGEAGGDGSGKTLLYRIESTVYFEFDGPAAPTRAFAITPRGGRVFLRWNKTVSRRWRSQVFELEDECLRVIVDTDPVVDVEFEFSGTDK